MNVSHNELHAVLWAEGSPILHEYGPDISAEQDLYNH